MNLRLELSTTWQLWPLVTWEWYYCGYEFCERCYSKSDSAHFTRRTITVTVHLPFAALTVRPIIEFKTRVATEGCPNEPGARASTGEAP